MDCPNCHAPNPGDSRFCNRCGTLLAGAPAAAPAMAPAYAAPPRPAVPAYSPPARAPASQPAAPGYAPPAQQASAPAYAPPPYSPPPQYAPPPAQYAPPQQQYAAPQQHTPPPQQYTPPPQQYTPPPRSAPPVPHPAPPQYAPPQAPGEFAYAGTAAAALPAGAAGLIQRIVNITLKPKAEWPVIAAEPPSLARVVIGCVLPLAAIQAVLSFVHMAVIGVSVPFAGSVRMPMASSLTAAVMGFVFALIGVFIFALIVNAWAGFFNGRRSLGEALKVAAYAGVPAWLGAFLGILPLGTLLGLLAALYAIYVLYLGLPIVMRAPKERAVGYTVAVILSGIVLGIVLGALGAAVGGFNRFGMMRPSAQASADQGAAITGNILGNMLGTDDKGKAALGAALGNLARAGQQMERENPTHAAPAQTPAEAAAQAQQSAQQTGNLIGGMLGTDAQGRSALGAALGNLVTAGQQAQGQNGAAGSSTTVASAQGAPNPDAAANTGAAVGGLLNALGGALGGSKRFTPVDFRALGEVLPASVNGLPRGATEGANKQAMGVHGSSASARYGGTGSGSIQVEISDVSGVAGLMGLAENLQQTTDAQTADGFERDVTLGGRKVHEKFTNASRHGELSVIVGQRFTVDLEGNGVDMAALEQALGQVDLGKLESMRNVGAQN